jgi:magnesium chelatase family protein
MLATVFSRAQFGMEAPPVTIDMHVNSGLPSLCVVGLAEAAVKGSKGPRALGHTNSGFCWPPARVTANLSPADLPKCGFRRS